MLDRFYLIVDSADWLDRFLPLGLSLVQLRIKDADEATLRREFSSAIAKCRAADATLVVNDYWELAIDLKADWLHLGQEDLETADLAAIRAAGIRFGVSTHDDAELETALAARPDYIALGPVFPTTLKELDWAPQGLEKVTDWQRRLDVPLVAIGGITLQRAPAVFAAGADILCASTDVLGADDPEARLGAWLDARATWTRGTR
ncbi:thiamine phosphate synthase [Rhodobium gokarnense]|uniref:Thiamine-phosphate synthase n=1 Tax=Rhodobium gokarnense TaxID=364296 RepID=A0ABT3H9Z7_9HYPH|nr:thiamine phosphate synthase [Rhodobium gokarnense]MCW2307228.1 thiamine-phosphate diphosphorylase [Rhodobium gokarnense]